MDSETALSESAAIWATTLIRLTGKSNEEVLESLLESYKTFERLGWPEHCSVLWWKLLVSVHPLYPSKHYLSRSLALAIQDLIDALHRLAFRGKNSKMMFGYHQLPDLDAIQNRYPLSPKSAAKTINEFCDAMGIPGEGKDIDED